MRKGAVIAIPNGGGVSGAGGGKGGVVRLAHGFCMVNQRWKLNKMEIADGVIEMLFVLKDE